MARSRKPRRVKAPLHPRRKALYPNGWPGNLRAVLYLNNRQRLEKIQGTGGEGEGEASLYADFKVQLFVIKVE